MERALKFLNRMSVNCGAVAGEPAGDAAAEDSGLAVAVGEVSAGRPPAKVGAGVCAGKIAGQKSSAARNEKAFIGASVEQRAGKVDACLLQNRSPNFC